MRKNKKLIVAKLNLSLKQDGAVGRNSGITGVKCSNMLHEIWAWEKLFRNQTMMELFKFTFYF
jgi:hypothetical protein